MAENNIEILCAVVAFKCSIYGELMIGRKYHRDVVCSSGC